MINEILFPVFLFITIFCFECCLLYNPERKNKLPQAAIPTPASNEICTHVVTQLAISKPQHQETEVPQTEAEMLQSISADSSTPTHQPDNSQGIELQSKKKTPRRTNARRSTADPTTPKASTRRTKKAAVSAH